MMLQGAEDKRKMENPAAEVSECSGINKGANKAQQQQQVSWLCTLWALCSLCVYFNLIRELNK